MKNKVSILVNCHNGSQTLYDCLSSIQAQSYTNWELVFVDNQSDDGSAEIAKEIIPDLKYLRTDKFISLGQARCFGVDNCDGEYIAFLDVDDIWNKDKLLLQVEAMAKTSATLCYGGITVISGKRQMEQLPRNISGPNLGQQLQNFEVNMVTAMICNGTLKKHSLNFDPQMQASEEYNLFIKLAALGDFVIINQPLGVYRASENSLTYKKVNRWWIERKLSLTQLVKQFPDECKIYHIEFEHAKSRGRYYLVQILMQKRKYTQSRKILLLIGRKERIYLIFWLLAFTPSLWSMVHSDRNKRYLTTLIRDVQRYFIFKRNILK